MVNLRIGSIIGHLFYPPAFATLGDSLHGYIITGGLLLCGAALEFIMHRSGFCFACYFREPFMTGDAAAAQAVIISLLISVLGYAVIKWTGLCSELVFPASSFGLGGLVGGFIFGFGMLLTGGCGSGTVWRAAEGQVKLMVALVTFALSTYLTKTLIRSTESIRSFIGCKVFLRDLFGYPLGYVLCLSGHGGLVFCGNLE
jgi:uncharacterized protein